MTTHIIAVVEPTPTGDATIDIAREVVDRGGRATVVMVVGKRARKDIQDFATAEELSYGDASVIALDRIGEDYAHRVGRGTEIVTAADGVDGAALLAHAKATGATSVAVMPELAAHRRWRRPLAASDIPVIVAPV